MEQIYRNIQATQAFQQKNVEKCGKKYLFVDKEG
jgi:hypothetical protein